MRSYSSFKQSIEESNCLQLMQRTSHPWPPFHMPNILLLSLQSLGPISDLHDLHASLRRKLDAKQLRPGWQELQVSLHNQLPEDLTLARSSHLHPCSSKAFCLPGIPRMMAIGTSSASNLQETKRGNDKHLAARPKSVLESSRQ